MLSGVPVGKPAAAPGPATSPFGFGFGQQQQQQQQQQQPSSPPLLFGQPVFGQPVWKHFASHLVPSKQPFPLQLVCIIVP
eukprot:1139334-Pelagomonas_calceolata.AAC.4